MSVIASLLVAALTVTQIGVFQRDEKPEGLSGITRIEEGRYCCVDDSGGNVCEYQINFDSKGVVSEAKLLRTLHLSGRADLEGCAFDPLTGKLWVSDEKDDSVRAFDLTNGHECAALKLPSEVADKFRNNRSLESLTISPDGKTLWTASEDSLSIDGPLSSHTSGAAIRLMCFKRASGDSPWAFDHFVTYHTDTIAGVSFLGHAVSGISDFCALPDGSLLVLEREFSAKSPFEISFRARLYLLSAESLAAGKAEKKLLWGEDTAENNYEGICLGPKLPDGRQILLLVSDGDGESGEYFMTLAIANR